MSSAKGSCERAEMFSRIARRYDFLNHLLSLNLDRAWRRRVVEAVGVRTGGLVLDACAGTGDVALAFARRSAAAGIVAVDLSAEMLRIGRKKAGEAADGRIVFAEGDVLRLPFRDGSFDAVVVAFGLRNLGDCDAGLSEMARVLVPRGRAAVLEFAPPRSALRWKAYAFYLRCVIPLVGGIVSGSKEAYAYLASSVAGFLPARDVLEAMRRAGFRDLSATPLTGGIAYVYCGEK